MDESFSPIIQKLVHNILKLKYKVWKEAPSDGAKIQLLLMIKKNVNIIAEFKPVYLEDTFKYLKEIDK